MENTKELVKIKASDYGLEESKAKEIEAMFTPMMSKMAELENEYNNILKLEISPETCQMAKDLRLAYVKIRTGTADIHQKLKAFYLAGGRFVDAFKNTQAFASGEKEATLKSIEKHYEILAEKEKERLKEERTKLISPYMEEVNSFSLGEMSEEVWVKFLAGTKLEYETRIAAEKKAEEERIAKEKAEEEERERQRIENIKLKEEAIERERLAEIERKKQADILAKQKAEADEREAILKAKADAERKERERLAGVIESKRQAEEKAKREEDARIEAEKKAKAANEKAAKLAPDKEKILAFGQIINDLPRPEVKSIEAAAVMSQINGLLVELNNYIITEANKL